MCMCALVHSKDTNRHIQGIEEGLKDSSTSQNVPIEIHQSVRLNSKYILEHQRLN